VAEEYLAYVREADLRKPLAPDLAGKGRIAFVRDSDIWLMDADGSGQRKIVELGARVDEDDEYGWRPYPRELTWSPDGKKLAFGMTGKGDGVSPPPEELHIVSWTEDEKVLDTVYSGLVGGGWSPDSTRIGIVRDAEYDGMGGGATGLPGVLDVRDGLQTIYRSERQHHQRPPSFSADGTMLLAAGLAPDGTGPAFAVWDLDGNELYSVAQPADGFLARPRWSPAEPKLAFHVSEDDRPSYAVTTPDGAVLARIDAPRASDKIGGRCGGADMWRTDWSLDGRHVLFSFDIGDTGANGIWIWDVGSGEQRLVPAANAGPAAAGPDGRFAFESYSMEDSYIFIGDVGGGFPRLLTDGGSPAWTPV
jgi:Tol biopolymer transport system component